MSHTWSVPQTPIECNIEVTSSFHLVLDLGNVVGNIERTETEGETLTPTPQGADRIVLELRRRILHGQLLPGEQLRQEELAKELSVSRVPLREALLILSHQGLLNHKRNVGFIVAKRSLAELQQLQRLLAFLESELEVNLSWPTETELLSLLDLNARMAELVDVDDWTELLDLNHEFHMQLWRLSGLNLFIAEIERIWSLADAYISQTYALRKNRLAAVEHHRAILTALGARDRTALLKATSDHRHHSNDEGFGVFRLLLPDAGVRESTAEELHA